jgi:mono/diheme cytochrome c family protein
VQVQVEKGGGAMPSFASQLTPAEIRDVSAFVATRAGG